MENIDILLKPILDFFNYCYLLDPKIILAYTDQQHKESITRFLHVHSHSEIIHVSN